MCVSCAALIEKGLYLITLSEAAKDRGFQQIISFRLLIQSIKWILKCVLSKNSFSVKVLNSKMVSFFCMLCINISLVVEFQRWWVLKSKLFGQESTCHQGKIFKKILRIMTGCQKVPKLYFQSQFWTSKINRIFS